ncbi:probable ATP-dependent RNA helicase prh1 [Aspergillus udagawae]|uniref:RNA helicase n=1 Tax=Aspergillus udagawae TaxID=91492 RepID=A0A8E0QH09_9EURO|nr:putative ATP-dependent RNA helicase dhr2 [Aspergillus udagawae]GFF32576.1 probable ATP-dependent RNA helicase prh1 [Aspergillus udagawae]GFF72635.1 probable ATP-dependent RNA helicase prh1 [Aspergillus udagawae]GFG00509.1 probable ATP-dependent RNA helicase prh1 [Aspergillus udagawae]GFG19896.1 probable ATP-dependent RNA helicase prh1 [Aspergillus udagawae]GIC85082.1 putative ATP-dependent RNA helicase dhr2 [Aspergillus udagawae]
MPERVRIVFDDADDVPVPAKVPEAEQFQGFEPVKRKDQPTDHQKKKNKKRKVEGCTDSRSQESSSSNETQADPVSRDTNEKHAVNGVANGTSEHPKNKKHKAKNQAPQGTKNNFTSLREKAKALYETRKNLPIFPHGDEIRQKLRANDVMLLVGETGSGKSTQIPQFLVDERWCRPTKATVTQEDGTKKELTVGGCIAITQPRRVAAISLARRVAEEMGTPLGSSSPASKVGYSVRFDTSTSPSTRIKFLTEGMLLQEMLHDPSLTKYSAIVVDEVHERGVNVDLVLGFLRNLVSGKKEGRGGVPLKVVVMSATADMESLMDFFKEGLQAQGDNKTTNGKNDQQDSPQANGEDKVSVCHIKGRQFPVKTIYAPAPVHDFVDAALKVIFQIHYKEPMPGDILVFLTGQETVEALEHLVNEYATGMDPALPKIQVLPLFAALPQVAQQRVFLPAPPRTRKIILATNIAETSVTVSGVRFVVDCGKAKIKQFRTRLGLDSLLVKPISKSAAIQRKGRAGREAPGQCYRLYTEKDYLALDETNTPEILRCDLSQALLNMKARGVDDVMGFPFLTRPPRESLEKALLQLLSIDALEESGKISSIGLHIAKLPLTPTLGRVLLAASEHGEGCLLDVIDIISCLSVENIFLNTTSEEKKEEAEKARRDLYRREGDHLTMLATVQAYAAENTDRKAWAERHMVSHRAMQSVMDVRKQLTMQCRQAKLLPSAGESRNASNNSATREPSPVLILQSFLRGFSTNTARLVPDGSYRTVVGNQTVAIHPSSVLFGKKVEAIMYNEFVFTNRSYARGVSAVQMDWVGDALTGAL